MTPLDPTASATGPVLPPLADPYPEFFLDWLVFFLKAVNDPSLDYSPYPEGEPAVPAMPTNIKDPSCSVFDGNLFNGFIINENDY